MRLAAVKSRLALVDERGAIDVAAVSAGKFSPDPQSLSAVLPLLPGDLIFTGTPAGIGWARDPRVVLRPGDRLVTHAEVNGEMRTTFTVA